MKPLVAALGVAVVGAGVVAGVLWRDLNDVRVQSGKLRDRVISLQSAQVAANLAPPPASAVAAPGAAAGALAVNAAQPGAVPAVTPAASKGDALMEGIGKVLATQEGKDMIVAQLRMMLPQQFPDLAKELGFTKAEEEKFFDLLVKQQAALSGEALGALGAAGGDPAQMQELQRKVREQQQAQQAELNTMLGSKAPLWQEYQKTLPVRRQVNQLQSALGEGNALSASQSKALMTTVAAEQARIQEDRINAVRTAAAAGTRVPNSPDDQLKRELENNERLVNAASSQLSPQQLDAYKKLLQQQTEMGRRLMQAIAPMTQ